MSNQVRVRIAPSPTGNLHIGTTRAALFNYLYAKKNHGSFILRIEDTDPERSTKEFEENILSSLDWLGLGADEGPTQGGPYTPYRQSERLEKYQGAVTKLLEDRKAYPCFCTPEQLEEGRKQAQKENRAYIYPGTCRNFGSDEVERRKAGGEPFAIRFTVPQSQTITFHDLVRGSVQFESSLIGDFVIQKADGTPLYSLANVVDDSEMKISHVLRGEDLLPSTPNQLLLYDALDHPRPEFGHLPLLLNPDRTKLSKRKGATSIDEFRAEGYLSEALVNFIAFLGWSPGTEEEFFSLVELEKAFSLERVQHAGAVFDERRLRYINSHYIKGLDDAELLRRLHEWLASKSDSMKAGKVLLASWKENYDVLRRAAPIARERAETLADLVDPLILYLSPAKQHTKSDLLSVTPLSAEESEAALSAVMERLQQYDFEETTRLDEILDQLMSGESKLSRATLFPLLRVALFGPQNSPGISESLFIFGKEESLKRIRAALYLLAQS